MHWNKQSMGTKNRNSEETNSARHLWKTRRILHCPMLNQCFRPAFPHRRSVVRLCWAISIQQRHLNTRAVWIRVAIVVRINFVFVLIRMQPLFIHDMQKFRPMRKWLQNDTRRCRRLCCGCLVAVGQEEMWPARTDISFFHGLPTTVVISVLGQTLSLHARKQIEREKRNTESRIMKLNIRCTYARGKREWVREGERKVV